MKKYLVTGGTGFIGRNLVRSLIKAGYNVRILDDNSRGNDEGLKDLREKFEFVKGDIRDPNLVRKACKNIDGVFHLAAVNGTKFFYLMPEVVLDVATRGVINVIDACLWHGVGEIYFASSSEVYQTPPLIPTPENVPMIVPDPFNPRYSYGGGKIISELLIINYGRKYFKRAIIFRPHNVFGPEMGWDHVIPQFITRMGDLVKVSDDVIRFPIQGSGKETRAFIYIDDFIDGLMKLTKSGKHLEVYNIGSEEEITIEKVAREIAKLYNRKIVIVPGKIQKGGTKRRSPDISKIKKLGFLPKYTFWEGLRRTFGWYNENAFSRPPVLNI